MKINFLFGFLFGLILLLLASFSFYFGWQVGDEWKENYVEVKDDYRSLNHRLNNLEQNYDRVIRLYTLGREGEKGE